MAGKHHAPVAIAKGAFGTGGKDATRLGQLRGDSILAAQAVLQQDQFGVGRQSMVQLGDCALGVIGFACHQQAMNRPRAVGCFAYHWVAVFYAMFHQGQPLGCLIAGQARLITQDQPDGHARARQTCGPECTQAAGAENMPGGRHQFLLRRVARSERDERTAIMPRHFSLGALHLY